jgi:ankyrin repeat-rich membrane spanning protein
MIESDIFIGIYAWLYGQAPEGSQTSYIDQEYEYARKMQKPIFPFVVDRNIQWPAEFVEKDEYSAKMLDDLKSRIYKNHTVAFFTSPSDLTDKVLTAVKNYLPVIDAPPQSQQVSSADNINKPPRARKGTATVKKSKQQRQQPDNVPAEETPSGPSYLELPKPPRTDSDRPSGIDRLNYAKYAESFAKIILNPETSTPLTIGIYGQWGQGKSFLMGKIKEALAASQPKRAPFSFSAFWNRYNPGQVSRNASAWLSAVTRDKIKARIVRFSGGILNGGRQLALGLDKPGTITESYRQWRRELRQKRTRVVDFHIVEFNAWAYVGTDHLWAGLVTHLYKEAERYFGLQLQLARLGQAVRRALPKSILIFGFYALLGLGASLLFYYNEVQADWDVLKIAVNAIAGSFIGGSAIASLPTLLATLKEFFDHLVLTRSKDLQNLAARPDFRAQIGVMADIKNEISFISRLLRKGKKGRSTRFILFIDDLDRCEHKKAVEVMQAIMLLLADEDGAPFVIFMGIDARVIVHAIEATYGSVLVNAGINGYEYLDKIVQVPFVIPGAPPDDIRKYVDSMLWSEEEKALILAKKAQANVPPPPGATPAPAAAPAPGTPGETPPAAPVAPPEEISVSFTEQERNVINDCAEDLIDNPRKIKRIINIYRFARLILPAAQDRAKAIHWYLLTEQWPLHIAWILEYIENDLQTRNEFRDKTIQDVYELAKKDICSKEMESLLTIDADPDQFERFIARHNFSVEEILALLPSTFNLNPAIRSGVSKEAIRLSGANAQATPPKVNVDGKSRRTAAKTKANGKN